MDVIHAGFKFGFKGWLLLWFFGWGILNLGGVLHTKATFIAKMLVSELVSVSVTSIVLFKGMLLTRAICDIMLFE